jgi:hypothetical protein
LAKLFFTSPPPSFLSNFCGFIFFSLEKNKPTVKQKKKNNRQFAGGGGSIGVHNSILINK